jgi:hypothetical protein
MNDVSDQDDQYDDTLSDLMRRAEGGDVLAAKQVVETLALSVSSTHTMPDWNSDDPTRRIPIPLQNFIRDYLSRALLKISSGTDARDAFHLRKRGRRQYWAHGDKRLAVGLMQQLVWEGLNVAEASRAGADNINAFAKKDFAENRHSIWRKFAEKPIDATTLHTWYFEH